MQLVTLGSVYGKSCMAPTAWYGLGMQTTVKFQRQLMCVCVCGDVGREVIRLTHSQGNLIQGQGPYLLLTPYTHGVPHVDCEGPCAVTRTNPLLPPGRKDIYLR
jgi:hypothetical protein